jgi:hypothetical protein
MCPTNVLQLLSSEGKIELKIGNDALVPECISLSFMLAPSSRRQRCELIPAQIVRGVFLLSVSATIATARISARRTSTQRVQRKVRSDRWETFIARQAWLPEPRAALLSKGRCNCRFNDDGAAGSCGDAVPARDQGEAVARDRLNADPGVGASTILSLRRLTAAGFFLSQQDRAFNKCELGSLCNSLRKINSMIDRYPVIT